MPNNTIYLIRHGITNSNKKKIYAGWSGEDLIEEGVFQAKKLGNEMRKKAVSVIFSSPIRRAVQTAQILNEYIDCELKIEHDLKEIKMGPWEGLSEEEVAFKYPSDYKMWLQKPAELNIKGRETLDEVQQRAIRAVNNISEICPAGIAIAVTHVAIIRCLFLYFNHLPLNLYKTIHVHNLSIHQLVFEKKSCAGMRELSHIKPDVTNDDEL